LIQITGTLKKNQLKARNHYRANRADYQLTALEEAHEAGVDVVPDVSASGDRIKEAADVRVLPDPEAPTSADR